MGPDLTSLPRTTACPSCGGALRPEATWCSLCFYDFRAASAPAPAPEPVVEQYGGPPPLALTHDPLTGPLLDVVLPPVPAPAPAPAAELAPVHLAEPAPRRAAPPTWPCSRCGEPNSFDSTVCLTCGAGFLEAATQKPSFVVPGVGDLMEMSRGTRVGLALAVLASVLVPLAVLTLLLTGSPPPKSASQPVTPSSTPYTTVVPPQTQVAGP